MPKPIDEDRQRRKELLEQKRAARKAKREQEEAIARTEKRTDEASDSHKVSHKSSTSSLNQPCYIIDIPEESLELICSFLCAADLGRLLLLTGNRTLAKKRFLTLATAYLADRLHEPYYDDAGITSLLEQARHAGGDTGRLQAKHVTRTGWDFPLYARFLEQAVMGYGTVNTREGEEERLPPFAQGCLVSASPEHTLVRIGGSSGVASWGVGKRGQLGHGKRLDVREPKRLQRGIGYLPHLQIVQVSAGGGLVRVAHSLLLTNTGRVLSFGTGQYGALGHGYSAAKQLPDVLRPTYIEALSHVTCVCVAAGELHSAVVTSDGDVYTWGDGFCGQTGHGDKRPQLLPKQVVKGGLEDECVSTVTCGSRHTVVITDDGEAFSFGLGHFGVLGRSFSPFDYDADATVVAFAGANQVDEGFAPVALDQAPVDEIPANNNDNVVNNMAQELRDHLDLIANLSLDDSSDQCYPKKIEALQGIRLVGASAGHRHTLFLDQSGALYSCGAGSSGCLGHEDRLSQMYPVRISSLEGVSIRRFSAGVDMSMAVSTTGTVYAWGRTDGGRLGFGLGRGEVTLPRPLPLYNEKGGALKAVDVDCGYVHSLIVALDGTVHICGGVGVDGEADGQREDVLEANNESSIGAPRQIRNVNLWHRLAEPGEEQVKQEKWKKYGKYEIRGRSKMMS